MDFASQPIIERKEKCDKFLDLARELKKLWNMKVTVIPIGIGALGTIPKSLVKGLEELEIGGWTNTILCRGQPEY